MNVRLIALAVVLLAGTGGYTLFAGSADHEPQSNWSAYSPETEDGIRALIFAEKPDETSEEMADWADYLNDFASGDEEISVSFEISDVCKALIDEPGCDEPFSTLFLNRAGQAFFYEGIIVEPQVYGHAEAALRGKDLTPMLEAFASDAVSLK